MKRMIDLSGWWKMLLGFVIGAVMFNVAPWSKGDSQSTPSAKNPIAIR